MKSKVPHKVETCKQYSFKYKKKGETASRSVTKKLGEPLTRDIIHIWDKKCSKNSKIKYREIQN